jgi:hypothetical protein
MCIRKDVSHCSLQGNIPPPESREDCGRSFMWSDFVSLHAVVTISKTWLVAWCGQTPVPYCVLHSLIHNGKRHKPVVLCLFRYQRIKGKKCIQKCCYISRRSKLQSWIDDLVHCTLCIKMWFANLIFALFSVQSHQSAIISHWIAHYPGDSKSR